MAEVQQAAISINNNMRVSPASESAVFPTAAWTKHTTDLRGRLVVGMGEQIDGGATWAVSNNWTTSMPTYATHRAQNDVGFEWGDPVNKSEIGFPDSVIYESITNVLWTGATNHAVAIAIQSNVVGGSILEFRDISIAASRDNGAHFGTSGGNQVRAISTFGSGDAVQFERNIDAAVLATPDAGARPIWVVWKTGSIWFFSKLQADSTTGAITAVHSPNSTAPMGASVFGPAIAAMKVGGVERVYLVWAEPDMSVVTCPSTAVTSVTYKMAFAPAPDFDNWTISTIATDANIPFCVGASRTSSGPSWLKNTIKPRFVIDRVNNDCYTAVPRFFVAENRQRMEVYRAPGGGGAWQLTGQTPRSSLGSPTDVWGAGLHVMHEPGQSTARVALLWTEGPTSANTNRVRAMVTFNPTAATPTWQTSSPSLSTGSTWAIEEFWGQYQGLTGDPTNATSVAILGAWVDGRNMGPKNEVWVGQMTVTP